MCENKVESNYGVTANNINGDVNVNVVAHHFKKSIVGKIVKTMIEKKFFADEQDEVGKVYKIDEKISYNHIVKYKEIIEDYSKFYDQCSDVINKIDDASPGEKNVLFSFIKNRYSLVKNKYINLENNKIDGDGILDEFIKMILEELESCDALADVYYEYFDLNLTVLIVYLFMECKILEKPKGMCDDNK